MKLLNIEKVRDQVRVKTPESVIQLIAVQIGRAEEAKKRIDSEGVVVRDMKGSVIPHPAIKVEIDAAKIVVDLLTRNKR